jgi:predicted nucleic acid-binding Zn ribbon protein
VRGGEEKRREGVEKKRERKKRMLVSFIFVNFLVVRRK